MAKHYEVFYSLEKVIRTLVADTIETAEKGPDWWSSARVPAVVQTEVASRVQKELDAGVTRRSLDERPLQPLAEYEQLRLQLTVRDWFRLME